MKPTNKSTGKPAGKSGTTPRGKSDGSKPAKSGVRSTFKPAGKPKSPRPATKTKPSERPQSASFEEQRADNSDYIYGRNSVMEALEAGHEINKLLILDGQVEGSIRKIIQLAKDKGIVVQQVERQKLNLLTDGGNHQGVLAYISPYDYADLEDIIAKGKDKEQSVILLLDEVSDPHNLGSIIRSADAFGVTGVVIPKRRSAALSATVAKTAVGALEYMPVARVNNLNQTIEELKECGYWIVGAEMTGEPLGKADLKGKIAIVLGSEGFGIARLTKEKCDKLVKIPMVGKTSSLNVSVAASIILYEVSKQHHGL
jgi:23S rRNA (guanosine2251-2'-O)-methyltransferase